MQKKPTILQTQVIAKSRLFHIEQIGLRFANGAERVYERLRSSKSAVMMVPMLDAETVLLVKEYAAGMERYEIGLPKGLIDPGEDMLAAANRELMEEIGYGAHQLKHVKTLTAASGYMNSLMHVVLAEDLYEARLSGDEPEELEVVPWSLQRLDELVAREDVSEGRSIAALFTVRELLRTAHDSD